MLNNAYKTPAEVIDEMIAWNDTGCPVLAVNETITNAIASISGGDGALTVQNTTWTDTTSTVWLTAGTAGQVYTITMTITTSAGRTFTRSIFCFVNATNPV